MTISNRLTKLFEEKNKEILSLYFTAGYPSIDDTLEIVKTLDELGVDFIEIGIPFSDSLVDGPVIQASNEKALENGMTIEKLFSQLKSLREVSEIPVILMGCINPILAYGMESFVSKAKEVGVDGALIADLPPKEFDRDYKKLFDSANLSFIPLVTKHCNEERIRYLDDVSRGFLYLVSSDAITGSEVTGDQKMANISELNCKNPNIIGFGITNRENFLSASKNSNGAIIGSAFIRVLGKTTPDSLKADIKTFVNSILGKE